MKLDSVMKGTFGATNDAARLAETEQRLHRATELSGKAPGEDEAALEEAAKGFESMLMNQVLQSLWSTVEQNGLLGENSNEASIYRDMYNQALADEIAEGKGVGLKEFLKKELRKGG